MPRPGRPATRAALALVGLVLLLGSWFGVPTAAWAAGDSYDRFDVAYVVDAEGTVHVTETIVLRFGSGSGRHGLERYLVTREPFDADRDMVYDITQVSVSSPDDVSTAVQESSYTSGPREQALRIRVGDANRVINAPTATYRISYQVRGALRTPGDYSEFFWDVTGSTMGAVKAAKVTVEVPGGVRDVACSAAPPGRNAPCTSATETDGVATFTQDGIPAGSLLTISVQIGAGQVANATPQVVDRLDASEIRQTRLLQGAGAVGAVGIPVLGWLFYRNRVRDERFAGLPPGTVPLRGQTAEVVPDKGVEVPVSFAPPKLPLTYAGYLLDGGFETKHLTATLVGAAVAGAVRLDSSGRPTAQLLDASRAPDAPTATLLSSMFTRGDRVDFGGAGGLLSAARALEADAARTAERNGWFRHLRTGVRTTSLLGLFWVALFLLPNFNVLRIFSGGVGWFLVPVTVSGLVTAAVVRARTARGQRSATGRAWTDQVEGFRRYIATAEADQLRFEEGEDIFSKYLPWAVLFGLADRWVRVCQQAIALGRLAEPDYGWYGGTAWNPNIILWNLSAWDHSIGISATPVVSSGPSFGSDTGFGGGGSAFGGGGGMFSGGGGGGGGAGSW